jgi:hypothetical protein
VRTAFLLVLLFALPAAADELAADATPAASVDDSHPILSSNAAWAGVVIIVVLGAFLAAAVIGPIVRVELPQTVPAAFSHHEDPSHHSGLEGDEKEPHLPPDLIS